MTDQECFQHKAQAIEEIAEERPVSCTSCRETREKHQALLTEARRQVWEEAAQDCILAVRDEDPMVMKTTCLQLSEIFRRRAQEAR